MYMFAKSLVAEFAPLCMGSRGARVRATRLTACCKYFSKKKKKKKTFVYFLVLRFFVDYIYNFFGKKIHFFNWILLLWNQFILSFVSFGIMVL